MLREIALRRITPKVWKFYLFSKLFFLSTIIYHKKTFKMFEVLRLRVVSIYMKTAVSSVHLWSDY